jgi:Vitamin K-dependent gamma-carboxylase
VTPSWLYERRDSYLLGLMRVAFACLLLLFTLKLGRQLWSGGYFGDVFHLPLLPEAWVPSRSAYTLLLALAGACCVLAALGAWARPALLLATLLHFYGFFCDRLQYHNNRYALLLLTCLVALTPCDRSFVAWRFGRRALATSPEARLGHRFMVRAVGAQLSLVYLSSSLGKAFDADWRGGTVMLLRFAEGHALLSRYLPAALVDVLQAPWFAHAASLAAIASELFIALGPWFSRSRPLALWLGVVFHLGIELSANVELFSYTMLSGYLAFATPELRERRLSLRADAGGRRLAWLVQKLDWLSRFELAWPQQESLLSVTPRDGNARTGLAAWRELARGLPALFPLWLPLWLVSRGWRR